MQQMSSTLVNGLRRESVMNYVNFAIEEAKSYSKQTQLFYPDQKSLEKFVINRLNHGKQQYALTTENNLLTYVKLSLLLGYNFEEDPFFSSLTSWISIDFNKEIATDVEDAFKMAQWYKKTYLHNGNVAWIQLFEELKEAYAYQYSQIEKITYDNWKAYFQIYAGKNNPLLEPKILKSRFEAVHYRLKPYGCLKVGTTMVYSILSLCFGIGMDVDPRYNVFRTVFDDNTLVETDKVMKLINLSILFCKNNEDRIKIKVTA